MAEEKTVRVRLFKDNGAYKNDVFVAVNGRTWIVRRGVEVEVPAAVAEVLSNGQDQDLCAARLMEEQEAGWRKAAEQA